jgi:hypothetical protein
LSFLQEVPLVLSEHLQEAATLLVLAAHPKGHPSFAKFPMTSNEKMIGRWSEYFLVLGLPADVRRFHSPTLVTTLSFEKSNAFSKDGRSKT